MAKSNPELISALRATANSLSNGAKYEWGHMGRCNCGHLVQTITNLSDKEIVAAANHHLDEWTEHAKDYCAFTGSPLENIFDAMKSYGFDHEDMVHLEYLSDKKVLGRFEEGHYLRHNQREDVALYLNEMADLLEEELV